MKEFIDKLIERLEELRKRNSEIEGQDSQSRSKAYANAISIINQLAEEYKVSEMPTGWISVSERLPKEDERILCLHSDGFIDCGVLVGETWCCDMDEYSVIRDDIHAWMPLPAPFKEGE